MKLFILALFSVSLLGQIQLVPNVPMPEARVIINNNFAYLDSKQLAGTTLPANCTVGQIFIKTNAPAGQNTYVALATGSPCSWTLQGGTGGGGAGLADPGSNGLIKRTAVNVTAAAVPGTDFQVPLGFTAENIANKDTDTALTANSDTRYPSQKAVRAFVAANGGITDPGANGIMKRTALNITAPAVAGTDYQAPLGFTAENVVNKDVDGTMAANSDTKYPSQKAVRTYVAANAGGSAAAGPASAVQSTNGSGILTDSGCTATGGQITCPSGFVSTSSSPTLIMLNEGTAPATPAANKGYLYLDSATPTKGLSFKDAGGIVQRTVKPTTCSGGTPVVSSINADGTVTCAAGGAGGGYSTVQDEGTALTQRATINFIGAGVSCADNAGASKTDCTIAGGGGGGGTAGTVYTQSFTSQTSVALAHNLALSPTTAFTGQCFDSTGNQIVPANLVATDLNTVTATFGASQTGSCTINAGGGAHFYSATMSSATSWTVAGTTHKLATCDLDVMAWDASTGVRHKVTPADVSCDDTAGAYTVTLTFGAAQAGRLVLIAAK